MFCACFRGSAGSLVCPAKKGPVLFGFKAISLVLCGFRALFLVLFGFSTLPAISLVLCGFKALSLVLFGFKATPRANLRLSFWDYFWPYPRPEAENAQNKLPGVPFGHICGLGQKILRMSFLGLLFTRSAASS